MRGPARIAVLGGSSAYVPALAAALADAAADLPALQLNLLGRREQSTAAVARFCNLHGRQRGVEQRYRAFTDVSRAAEGADVIVLCVRVGGWVARRHDDTFPLAQGLPGDETIGPGGLASTLRTVPVVRDLVSAAHAVAAGAPVVVMTNPLGTVTAALAAEPGVTAFGLCELPQATLAQACALIGVDVQAVDAHYVGVNHQGAWVSLVHDGVDRLPDVFDAVSQLPAGHGFAVDGEAMTRFGALPLKYLALYLHTARVVATQLAAERPRGAVLSELAHELFTHYATAHDGSLPPALARRSMPWWQEALVPCLVALLGGRPARLAVTHSEAGRGARECVVTISADGPHWPTAHQSGPAALDTLQQQLTHFEELSLSAVDAPDASHVQAALAAHPLGLSSAQVRALVPAVLADPTRLAVS